VVGASHQRRAVADVGEAEGVAHLVGEGGQGVEITSVVQHDQRRQLVRTATIGSFLFCVPFQILEKRSKRKSFSLENLGFVLF
jgi:hypothetical protein